MATFIDRVSLDNGSDFMVQTIVPKYNGGIALCQRIVNERMADFINSYGGGTYKRTTEDVGIKSGVNLDHKCEVTCLGRIGTGDRTIVLKYSYNLNAKSDYEAYSEELAKFDYTPNLVIPMAMTRVMYL